MTKSSQDGGSKMVFACISLNNLIFIIIITNLRTTFLARVIAHIADGKLSQVSVLNHCYLSKDTSEVIRRLYGSLGLSFFIRYILVRL